MCRRKTARVVIFVFKNTFDRGKILSEQSREFNVSRVAFKRSSLVRRSSNIRTESKYRYLLGYCEGTGIRVQSVKAVDGHSKLRREKVNYLRVFECVQRHFPVLKRAVEHCLKYYRTKLGNNILAYCYYKNSSRFLIAN